MAGVRKYGTKTNYSQKKLDEALDKVKTGQMSQRDASKKYKIPRSTLKYKLKGEHSKSVGRPKKSITDPISNQNSITDPISNQNSPKKRGRPSKMSQAKRQKTSHHTDDPQPSGSGQNIDVNASNHNENPLIQDDVNDDNPLDTEEREKEEEEHMMILEEREVTVVDHHTDDPQPSGSGQNIDVNGSNDNENPLIQDDVNDDNPLDTEEREKEEEEHMTILEEREVAVVDHHTDDPQPSGSGQNFDVNDSNENENPLIQDNVNDDNPPDTEERENEEEDHMMILEEREVTVVESVPGLDVTPESVDDTTNKQPWDDLASQEKINVLQTKLRLLEMQYQKKQLKIHRLQAALKENKMHHTEASEESNPYYDEIMTLLKNKSDGDFAFVKPEMEPQPLQASLSYTTMPHLLRHERSRYPALQILSPRNSSDVDVVIGIPTVKRDKENYLPDTVKSLIDGMTPQELQRTLIVISIGEANDLKYVTDTAYEINLLFEPYFGQLIEVICPTVYWYPDWDDLEPNLGDSLKRARWRTKQNLDAIFLMSYAQSKGAHYLMLEDDVLAKKGFMTEIMKYAANQTASKPNWFFINFSTTGGIGKFFRIEDLSFFSAYVQVFYQYMPIDWLIEQYLAGRVCGIDKSSQKCAELKSTIRPTYKTSLFEHAGLYSSLRGKIQQVKPNLRKGKDDGFFFPHKNPPLERIVTTIESQKEHSIERAYNGEDFFWGINPKYNDTIEFRFKDPLMLDKCFFRTSNAKQMKDIIKEGVVEVLPMGQKTYVHVDDFDEFGNAECNVDRSLGPLSAIRIRILENMKHRVIISEIELLPSETV